MPYYWNTLRSPHKDRNRNLYFPDRVEFARDQRQQRPGRDPGIPRGSGAEEAATQAHVDELTAMLESSSYRFTQAPNGTLRYAEQMFKTGVIKTQPASWKDAFFPIAHGLSGN